MFIAIPVTADGMVDPRWGRAHNVAIAEIDDSNKLSSWQSHVVRWDELHDEGAHGQHHARIVRFLRENNVEAVLVGHMGQGMLHTINKMGILIVTGVSGDARTVVNTIGEALRAEIDKLAQAESVSVPQDAMPTIGNRPNLV